MGERKEQRFWGGSGSIAPCPPKKGKGRVRKKGNRRSAEGGSPHRRKGERRYGGKRKVLSKEGEKGKDLVVDLWWEGRGGLQGERRGFYIMKLTGQLGRRPT